MVGGDSHGAATVALQACTFMGSIDRVSEQGHQGLVMVKWSRADVLAAKLFILHIHYFKPELGMCSVFVRDLSSKELQV